MYAARLKSVWSSLRAVISLCLSVQGELSRESARYKIHLPKAKGSMFIMRLGQGCLPEGQEQGGKGVPAALAAFFLRLRKSD